METVSGQVTLYGELLDHLDRLEPHNIYRLESLKTHRRFVVLHEDDFNALGIVTSETVSDDHAKGSG